MIFLFLVAVRWKRRPLSRNATSIWTQQGSRPGPTPYVFEPCSIYAFFFSPYASPKSDAILLPSSFPLATAICYAENSFLFHSCFVLYIYICLTTPFFWNVCFMVLFLFFALLISSLVSVQMLHTYYYTSVISFRFVLFRSPSPLK